jgi:hypothetical protein
MDIAKIKIWVPDQDALKEILSVAQFSLDCGSPKRDESGDFVITLYGPKAQANKLKPLGYRLEIDPTYGDTLKERQDQVSKEDRFKGGTVKPEGLGVKG